MEKTTPEMGPTSHQCCKVLGDGGGAFYIVSLWFPHHFTLEVSDGVAAWAKQEVKRPAKSPLGEEAWLDAARRALSPAAGGERIPHPLGSIPLGGFACKVRRTAAPGEAGGAEDHLEVRWEWKDEVPRHATCTLAPSGHALCSMLDTLVSGTAQLRDACTVLGRECEELRGGLSSTRSSLQRVVGEKAQAEEELYRRFTVVLNEKKAKVRELEEEREDRERDIREGGRRGGGGGSESEETTDDERSGGEEEGMETTEWDAASGGQGGGGGPLGGGLLGGRLGQGKKRERKGKPPV